MFNTNKKQKQIKKIFGDYLRDVQGRLDAAHGMASPIDKLAALCAVKDSIDTIREDIHKTLYTTYNKVGNGVATTTALTLGVGIALCFVEPVSGLILMGSGLGGGIGTALSMRRFVGDRMEKPYQDDIDALLDMPKKIQAQIDDIIAAKAPQMFMSEKFLGLYGDRLDMREDLTKVFFAAAKARKTETAKQLVDLCIRHPEGQEQFMRSFWIKSKLDKEIPAMAIEIKRPKQKPKPKPEQAPGAPQGFQLD